MNKETTTVGEHVKIGYKTSEQADKLRAEICGLCLEFDTGDIEKKLVLEVVRYTTPQARRAEIISTMQSGNYTDAHSEAMRLEYNALGRLIDSQEVTSLRFGSTTAAGVTLSMLTEGFDMPTLLNEIREQAQSLTGNDKEAIKALLADQAVLAHHVAQHTILNSKNAPTIEARAITAKHGVNMLETSARIVERLSKVDEPKQGNIYAKQANIAQNQLIQNGQKVDVLDKSSDNAKSDNQLLESEDDMGSNLSRLDAGKARKTVRSDTGMEALERVDGAKE